MKVLIYKLCFAKGKKERELMWNFDGGVHVIFGLHNNFGDDVIFSGDMSTE